MIKRVLLAAVPALLLAGCSSAPPLASNANLTVVDGTALPPPSGRGSSVQARPYLIGPYDTLLIDVYGVEDLTREVQADGSGRISIPLAGEIEAGGRTPAQLAEAIEEQLRGRYIRDPQVTVNLKETVSQVITVDGEVVEPGLYPVIGGMTLMNAIARAKGTDEFAKLDDVVVFRTVNDQRMAALYNLGAIRRGLYEDPEVYASDVVIVGNSNARRVFRDLLSASPLLTTPIIALIQR